MALVDVDHKFLYMGNLTKSDQDCRVTFHRISKLQIVNVIVLVFLRIGEVK
jgi:hypothetical protein